MESSAALSVGEVNSLKLMSDELDLDELTAVKVEVFDTSFIDMALLSDLVPHIDLERCFVLPFFPRSGDSLKSKSLDENFFMLKL